MKPLRFNADGRFRILQLTDIHYENAPKDRETLALLEKMIAQSEPDLIMLTGDSVYGPNNAEDIHVVLDVVAGAGRPWSLVFGNHDFEDGSGKERLFQEALRHPHAYLADEPEAGFGVGNHCLEIQNRQGQCEWLLFGLDSGGTNALPQMQGYDFIKSSQIEWYKRRIQSTEARGLPFGSLVFMHIPLIEFRELWDMETCYGERLEGICSSKTNSGFFHAMLEAGHGRGVFVGHDHLNNYCGQLYGIWLCYGRASGYNSYGRRGYQRGGRVIDLCEGQSERFVSFELLADGSQLREPRRHQAKRVREDE